MKTPINMKFGMQVRFSAIYNEFLSKFPYLPYFWPYGQKYGKYENFDKNPL